MNSQPFTRFYRLWAGRDGLTLLISGDDVPLRGGPRLRCGAQRPGEGAGADAGEAARVRAGGRRLGRLATHGQHPGPDPYHHRLQRPEPDPPGAIPPCHTPARLPLWWMFGIASSQLMSISAIYFNSRAVSLLRAVRGHPMILVNSGIENGCTVTQTVDNLSTAGLREDSRINRKGISIRH